MEPQLSGGCSKQLLLHFGSLVGSDPMMEEAVTGSVCPVAQGGCVQMGDGLASSLTAWGCRHSETGGLGLQSVLVGAWGHFYLGC